MLLYPNVALRFDQYSLSFPHSILSVKLASDILLCGPFLQFEHAMTKQPIAVGSLILDHDVDGAHQCQTLTLILVLVFYRYKQHYLASTHLHLHHAQQRASQVR